MAKRPVEDEAPPSTPLKKGQRPQNGAPGSNTDTLDIDFEDDFEDEYESEDEVFEAGVDGRPDAEREAQEKDAMDVDQQTFIPGRHQLKAGESLAPDPSAYDLLHSLTTTWPCLSFDILPDDLGDKRKTYPATLYAVAGTQAEGRKAHQNEIVVMKLSGLSRTDWTRDEDSDDDDDSEDENADAVLDTKSIPLSSTTNRIRAHRFPATGSSLPARTVTATMTEAAEVLVHDISPHIAFFDQPGTMVTPQQSKPLATLRMHRSEGYAVDWSPLLPEGKLLTGDNDGKIFLTAGADAGARWAPDTRPFVGHASSVEDLQWSPTERTVFASASSDGTVKVWDTRSKARKPAVDVKVSETDVNVLSWSRLTSHLLATGADDGRWAVWDLRQWKPTTQKSGGGGGKGGGNTAAASAPTPVAAFDFHREQVTSVEWNPNDDSSVAVAAADNTVTLWDLAVELDDDEAGASGVRDVPPQLLFVHYMKAVKECHWHPQISGCVMATGAEGFG